MCSSGDSISSNEQEEEVLQLVKWIGKLSLSLQRFRDAWMDKLPMSALSEEQRRSQYLADVAQENAEGQTRCETAWDPNTPENREKWNTAQVNITTKVSFHSAQNDNINVYCRK